MGKTALLAIAAFTLMGAFYGLASSSGLLGTSARLARYDNEVMARNAAVTGFELAKHKLSKDFVTTSFSGTFDAADYSVHATVAGQLVTVTSTATQSGLAGDGHFQIYARLKQVGLSTGEIAEEPPPFMQFALLSNGDLELGGSMTLDTVKIIGAEQTALNANVHTNGRLSSNGKKMKVRGFGTYRTTENVTHEKVFDPYANPTQEPVVKQVDQNIEVPVDDFDVTAIAQKYESQFGGVDSTSYGDVVLQGGFYDFEASGATRENPFIWVINGNFSNNGNVEINGYVMFLINGDAYVQGNLTTTAKPGQKENNLAIYTSGDIRIAGSVTSLWAQMFAKEDVQIEGSSQIYGNIAAGGSVITQGSPTIKYFPASPALTRHWQDDDKRLELLSYLERTAKPE